MPDKATFLQKAAADFRYRFVARLEENIRAGESWSYAKTCNAVSGEAGGREGMEACKALAARVSRLDDALMNEVEDRALALFAVSFGRHSRVPECRSGAIRIAEVCCNESRELWRQTNQGLSLLVNGFSKWPDAADCRKAAVAIAGEVARWPGRLSDTPQALANLVNGFSKWPDAAGCREAAVAIAGEVPSQLSNFNPQELANMVNGFSKWPDAAGCREAAVAIAGEVPSQLSNFKPQELANMVNGFSKWPDATGCREAAAAIAGEVPSQLSNFNPQQLSNLVNGFSKWPDAAGCREAAAAIAGEVPSQLSNFKPQELANLVNGFSKWPDAAGCREAAVAIAGEVPSQLSNFNPQHLANLVNGFSKWPDAAGCREAAVAIAGEVRRRAVRTARLSDFPPQALANLVNGFSKWPDAAGCREAAVAIAGEVPSQLSNSNPQQLANLVNGFSKWPDAAGCREAAVAIAGEVPSQLSRFEPQQLAGLVNGFSKWPDAAGCCEAAVAIAGEVPSRLSRFDPQELANMVNGFSKWPDAAGCREAAVAIAGEVPSQLSRFDPQALASLVNGFSKWPEDAACHQAVMDIARGLGGPGRRFGSFTTLELATIANALGRSVIRGEDGGDVAETALLKNSLHQLAHYLHYADDRLEQADVLSIATIFKALAKVRLFEDLGLLAPTGLDRLTGLHRAPGFAAENNLETTGNLCAALLPLARSPHLRWHRRQALSLLNDIQPVVEHKIEAHLNASEAERTRGPFASRCPALSIYQVLKARAVLETLFKRPYVEGKKPDLLARQGELQRKTKEILDSTRDLIESDLSNMSWNLIAQIESDNPLDVLDTFMAQDAARIQARHPASVFDMHEVLRSMDHEPRPPQGDAGLMQLPVVDMQGRRVATEPETRYSIFHRLTSGALPVVAVQLPAKLSTFMLARTLTVDGVPYRLDLFGGSKLKPPKPTLSQIAARAPGAQPAASSGGKLLAIPYAETAPGTAFEQLSRAWAPFKEAYWYTQRRGFAAPPAIKDLGPHDYALEGAFKLLLLPDRPATKAHPFKLTGPEGPIALRPHDGCGFIKASLAEQMPAVHRVGHQEGPDRLRAFGEGRRSSVPPSALQHYPRNDQVAEEASEKAKTWLESRDGRELTSEELFRTVTTGHTDGPGAVAVPSDDGCLHVPKLKSDTLPGTGGVLIGRAPYDKPNLRPLAAERVKSAADGDPTAAFLDWCVAMQYSFSVAQKSREELAADDPSFFAKGILIVVPDEMWPANYADRGLVMSAEDVKCHSSWTKRKDRATVDMPVDCVGILQATELFAPGSLVAVPPDEQKKLDGDFDGDAVIIIGDRPQLYQHVWQFDEKEQARGVCSLKPPKSHTPAIEDGNYQFSRASQILAATTNVLEIYSSLQRSFLAQSHQARRWFAERAIFGTYEGVHHKLRHDIRQLLNQEQVSGQDIEDKLERARRETEVADHPVARETAELLVADLKAWAARADEQVLPETAESDTKLTVSPAFVELFPELAEAYSAAPQPRDRIQVLLDHYPARIEPRPDGYNLDDLVQSANNLLSLGIKVGTDGYKSDTGVHLFMKKSQELQRLLQQVPGLTSVPFSKSLAATLSQGRFDVDAALEDLKDNPTLAASVMEASIKLAAEKHILPEPTGRLLTAEDAAMTVMLTREEAAERAQMEAARAEVEETEITATAFEVAKTLSQVGVQVNMPHLDRRLRSEASMTAQLTGMSVTSDDDSQLISSAVRHVFEVPDEDFASAFKKAVLGFGERGFAEISTTNWFRMRNPTFVGIKTVLATPRGYRFEAEFHTPDSYKAKIANHDTYKELEKLQQQSSGDALYNAEELARRAREVCKKVAIPDGAKNIPHWGVEPARRRQAGAAFTARAAEPGRREIGEIVTALGDRPIVLVGMPGAGKSTIGRRLAKRLRLNFIDSDAEIRKEAGTSIRQLCQTYGEQYFRDLEAKVIAHALKQGSAVLATGSDSLIHDQTRNLIHDKAVSIWLKADADVIMRRNMGRSGRRLLQTPDPKATVTQLIREREPVYQTADLTIGSGSGSHQNQADECVTALHAYLCDAGQGARQTGLFQELPVAPSSQNAGASGMLVQEMRVAAASSSAVARSSDIHASRGALIDLPHHLRVSSMKASDARTDTLDPTASLHRRSSLALDAQEWLGDEHIAADYALLEQEWQRENPGLAAQIRFAPPAPVQLLRLAENPNDIQETLMGIVQDHNGNDTANFLLLPVNDGGADRAGTHWSLLLVDRRVPERIRAYHYDSSGNRNRAVAEELATRLGARLSIAAMAQQQNDYDCGVFVLDATRALVERLAQGQRPEALHLDNIVADRQALRNRLSLTLAELCGVGESVLHAVPDMAGNFYGISVRLGHEGNLMSPYFASDRRDRIAEGEY
ncbi:shikimate kinase [Bradyrhizobium sp. USDA 10063]